MKGLSIYTRYLLILLLALSVSILGNSSASALKPITAGVTWSAARWTPSAWSAGRHIRTGLLGAIIGAEAFAAWMTRADKGCGVYAYASIYPSLWIGSQRC